jgi:hypothetical protein
MLNVFDKLEVQGVRVDAVVAEAAERLAITQRHSHIDDIVSHHRACGRAQIAANLTALTPKAKPVTRNRT